MHHPRLRAAIVARMAVHGRMDGIGWYTQQLITHLAGIAPELQLDLLFDRRPHPSLVPAGTNAHVLWPQARHPMLWHWWFERTLPRWLRAHRPDVLVSLEGFLPSRPEMPMVTVLHDVAYEHAPDHVRSWPVRYYRRHMPRAARAATRLCTVSESARVDIARTYAMSADDITVVPNGVRTVFRRRDAEVGDRIRRSYTDGAPYWLFVGTMQPRKNLTRLIRAFERFAASVDDRVALVIAGKDGWMNAELRATVEASPVRERIRFTGYVAEETLAELYAGAFGLVFVPLLEGFGVPIIEGFASGIPVIASNVSAMPEVAGDAAVLVDPTSVDEIGDAMVRVWRDEALRHALTVRGHARARQFTWSASADTLRRVIHDAVTSWARSPSTPS